MGLATFYALFHWLIAHAVHVYWFLFLLMLIEGPMVTTVAAFAASWGYFNPVVVFLLAIVGDMVPDALYYFIGYLAHFTIFKKFGHPFRLKPERQEKLEKFLKSHAVQTIIAIKLTPFLPTPGFIFLGSKRLHFGKFMLTCFWVTFIRDLIFILIGFYLGRLININFYFKYAQWVAPGLLVIFIGLYFLYRFIFSWLGRKSELC